MHGHHARPLTRPGASTDGRTRLCPCHVMLGNFVIFSCNKKPTQAAIRLSAHIEINISFTELFDVEPFPRWPDRDAHEQITNTASTSLCKRSDSISRDAVVGRRQIEAGLKVTGSQWGRWFVGRPIRELHERRKSNTSSHQVSWPRSWNFCYHPKFIWPLMTHVSSKWTGVTVCVQRAWGLSDWTRPAGHIII